MFGGWSKMVRLARHGDYFADGARPEWRDCGAISQDVFGSRGSPRSPDTRISGMLDAGFHRMRIIPAVSSGLELSHKPGRAITTRRAGKRL
jgi:hypothetical protein